jgi:hypothetical protein
MRPLSPAAVAATALVLCLGARTAAAQYATVTDNEKLKDARVAFEAEKWTDAIAAATAALDVPGNDLEENVEIHAIRGMAEALAGKKAAAVESFKLLLAMDYDHKFAPGMKPAVAAALAAARDWWKGKPIGIVVDHEGLPPPYAGEPIRVAPTVLDPLDAVKKTALFYRNGADKAWARVDGERHPGATRVELFIPGADVGAGLEIDYYVEFLDEHGGVVARLGEARSPRSTIVPGLPPGLAPGKPPPERHKVGAGPALGGVRLPVWAIGAAGGAAALVIGAIIWAVVPKSVDVTVVTCVAACAD